MSARQEEPESSGVATVLSAGTRARGDLYSREDLVLVGVFEGRLHVQRSLRIMPEARVEGEVEAERILVLGRTQGSLRAQQRIEIRSGAQVWGEIAAPQIRVHDGVTLNARVHMSGPPGPARHYLVPALLRAYDTSSPESLEPAEQATEKLLHELGFELETRAERADRSGTLRPIFRSREPMPYKNLRERLQRLEHALRDASGAPYDGTRPVQGTGRAGAVELARALSGLRRAAFAVGPVAITRLDENPGALHLAIRESRHQLPEPPESPDPAALLLSLQKLQHELLDDLN